MMIFIVALIAAPFTILTFAFAIEVLVGLRPLSPGVPSKTESFSAVVVVPAHDEELVLPSRLPGLLNAVRGQARVLLVADNCTDRTAAVARALGADVVERFDRKRRGKGYALDFARHALGSSPPDVVLIVDADCTIDAESVSTLIAICGLTGRACQATNLQRSSPSATPPVQLSTFAFYIKNVVRLRGLQRLAGRAHLLGTGMAIPWAAFAQADLATGNIVEDLKLGQDLAESGHAPLLVEQAAVWSNAETSVNTLSQRRRWEGGYLANAMRFGPRMMIAALQSGDARRLWAAIDTMIPPFTLLILLNFAAFVLSWISAWVTGASRWPAYILAGSFLLAGAAVALAWLRGGSRFVTLGGLVRIPVYVAWKLPMYIGLAKQGTPKEWVRTGRD